MIPMAENKNEINRAKQIWKVSILGLVQSDRNLE